MATKKKLLEAAAGSAGGGGLNVEDVFSTYLFDSSNSISPVTVTNGIDLSGEGGMVWVKSRDDTSGNGWPHITDTERGVGKRLITSSSGASNDSAVYQVVNQFNADGFRYSDGNGATYNYASWTFRKAPKFFDVVTYTGDGVAGRTVSHNLGSVPGCIIVKSTSNVESWYVYHRGVDATAPEDYFLELEKTAARTNAAYAWNDTAPTSTEFTVGSVNDTNLNGATFVAYLFAHNDGDGEFGSTADQDIIKCGSYTGTGADGNFVDLGFEPQFVLIKGASIGTNWLLFDNMRGVATGGQDYYLVPNTSAAEPSPFTNGIDFNSTGMTINNGGVVINSSGSNYIYIAIRRGPMAVPESATDVFDVTEQLVSRSVEVGTFPVDMSIAAYPDNAGNNRQVFDRLRGNSQTSSKYLQTNTTNAEASAGAGFGYDSSSGYIDNFNSVGYNQVYWNWKRAPSFFDVVAYTGNGTAGRTVSHNLGVAPEMMWIKKRNGAENWAVYHKDQGNTKEARLNQTLAFGTSTTHWNSTSPTDTEFTLGVSGAVNQSYNYIAYLFASLDGVSKVGSYTGNGTSQNIDCGFSNGARFVLIKRTNGTGNWLVFDTARGIVAGNDYLLRLNLTDAESYDYDQIDPLSSGFTVVRGGQAEIDVNYSGYEYIYYAIA